MRKFYSPTLEDSTIFLADECGLVFLTRAERCAGHFSTTPSAQLDSRSHKRRQQTDGEEFERGRFRNAGRNLNRIRAFRDKPAGRQRDRIKREVHNARIRKTWIEWIYIHGSRIEDRRTLARIE
jgi:hypothetical protein